MKKTLFLLMLLPFIGYSQENLVSWNTTSAPTPNVSDITASGITTNGNVTINNYGWSGFRINGFHTGVNNSSIDYNKYTQFSITANEDSDISLSQFNFTYYSPNGNNGPKRLQVRYSLLLLHSLLMEQY